MVKRNRLHQIERDIFRMRKDNVSPQESYLIFYSAAYISYMVKKYYPEAMISFNAVNIINKEEDKMIRNFLGEHLKDFSLEDYNQLLQYDVIALKEYLLQLPYFNREYHNTPDGLMTLANKILDLKATDVVGDFCSGIGNYSYFSAEHTEAKLFYQYDVLEYMIVLARIRANVLKEDPNYANKRFDIEKRDLLWGEIEVKFDKIFAHLPFGLRASQIEDFVEYKNSMPLLATLSKSNSLDWPFMINIYNALKDNGCAVVLSTVNTTYNLIDKQFRKYFVDNGFIKAVILLPERLLDNTSVATVLYVLGKNTSKEIRMINASEEYKPSRRESILTEENLDYILEAYKGTSAIDKLVGLEAIKENDYNLLPDRYLNKIIYENGVALKDIAKIKRGAMLSAFRLDKISSEVKTDYQYLLLSDINEGTIAAELNYLTKVDNILSSNIIKENNLVLSKMGLPFKVAVLDKRKESIIATGNMYIIEIDENKVDPYYLQAFLLSDEGQQTLGLESAGVHFSSLGRNALMNLQVPLPPLAEQKKIGQELKESLSRLASLDKELQEIKVKTKNIYKGINK